MYVYFNKKSLSLIRSFFFFSGSISKAKKVFNSTVDEIYDKLRELKTYTLLNVPKIGLVIDFFHCYKNFPRLKRRE